MRNEAPPMNEVACKFDRFTTASDDLPFTFYYATGALHCGGRSMTASGYAREALDALVYAYPGAASVDDIATAFAGVSMVRITEPAATVANVVATLRDRLARARIPLTVGHVGSGDKLSGYTLILKTPRHA